MTKPAKEKGAPAGAPEDAPDWLREAQAWKPPHAVSRRGRKPGSRSTLKRVRADNERLEVVDNAARDAALAALCSAMALGSIVRKADLDAQVRIIAARANVTPKTLRSDLEKQIAALPPHARGAGGLSVATVSAVMRWKLGEDARRERQQAEDEWIEQINRVRGN